MCYLFDFMHWTWDFTKSWCLKALPENELIFSIIIRAYLKKNVVSKNFPFHNNISFFRKIPNNFTIFNVFKPKWIDYDQVNFIFPYHYKQLCFLQITGLNIQISRAVNVENHIKPSDNLKYSTQLGTRCLNNNRFRFCMIYSKETEVWLNFIRPRITLLFLLVLTPSIYTL